MHRICKKLRGRRGETLVETLAAILVAVLSVGLLMGGVAAATRINRQAQRADEDFYSQLTAAEAQTEPLEDGQTFSVVIAEEGRVDVAVPARLYGGEDLYAYGRAPGEGSGP